MKHNCRMRHGCFMCRPPITPEIRVGDVFEAHGTGPRGRREGTHWWVVLGVRDNSAYLFGMNERHEVVSTATYGIHVLHYRRRVGRVKSVEAFVNALKC